MKLKEIKYLYCPNANTQIFLGIIKNVLCHNVTCHDIWFFNNRTKNIK